MKVLAKLMMMGFSIVVANSALADQTATWHCNGVNVQLEGRSPYLGEDSSYQQTLYVLTRNNDETNQAAYFLSVEEDIGRFGILYITGTNGAGGRFQYRGSFPKDESDGTVIRKTSEGTITYTHGPLHGVDEEVKCVFE